MRIRFEMKALYLLLSLLCTSKVNARNAPRLSSYNIDTSQITVSGLSSGGFFAVQFHVAYSKIIRGVGVIAGGPFWCARDNVKIATGPCLTQPNLISVGYLATITYSSAATFVIDPVQNMQNSQVYLLSGKYDSVVVPGVVKKLEEYYSDFVTDGNITSVYTLPAEHCFPTDDYGDSCTRLGSPYICNCNFSAAHEILKHVYPGSPNLKPSYQPENLFSFDQSEFTTLFTIMDSVGYIYVPTACQSKKTPCRLHIAFHGCRQGKVYLGDEYAAHTGYGEYAEGLNTIVIFPQADNSTLNPNGCWDWWGFTSPAYASKLGLQMMSIRQMIERVALI